MCLMTWIVDGKRNLILGLLESIENTPKLGRPESASCDDNVSKVKEIVGRDARYSACDIEQMVGISLSRDHYILKNTLNVRKISARWVPHLLSDGQNKHRVKIAKQLLNIFPKYDEKNFANIVTGDETCVHYFEPVRKVSNKIWATKNSKRPVIAKHMLSTKKILYAIFFSSECVAIQVPVKKGRSITGKYYRDVVLKKLKKILSEMMPSHGFQTCLTST